MSAVPREMQRPLTKGPCRTASFITFPVYSGAGFSSRSPSSRNLCIDSSGPSHTQIIVPSFPSPIRGLDLVEEEREKTQSLHQSSGNAGESKGSTAFVTAIPLPTIRIKQDESSGTKQEALKPALRWSPL